MINCLKTIVAGIGLAATLPFATASAQLTLDECQKLAWANYPSLKQYGLIEKTTAYSLRNVNRGYLPQLSFGGQATYQSDVANLPDALTNLLSGYGYDYKGIQKDQYKLTLDLNQVIWDGGNLEAQKDVTRQDGEVQKAQTDVEMYAVRNRVNELFFGILLLEEKIRLNEDLQTLLLDNCRKLENKLAHGTAMQADVDIVRAEYLNTRQDLINLTSMKKSYQQVLALFIHKDAADIVALQKPEAAMPSSYENRRPELALYAARMQQTDAQKRLLNAALRPKLSLFAQGYYGYPGYDMFGDMFDHDWSLNGIVGVRLTWNISRLYTHRNDKRKLTLARRQIETAQETFLFNNRLETVQEMEAIDRYRRLMKEDEEIIALRTSVRQAAETRLERGVIDVNDLLKEITRENQARTNHSSHEVEWLKNIYELRHSVNNEE